jgi:hypothetical protein
VVLLGAACAPDYGVKLSVNTSDEAAPVFDVPDREAITMLVVFSCSDVCPEILPQGSFVSGTEELERLWLLQTLGAEEDGFAYEPNLPLPIVYGVIPQVRHVNASPDPAPPLPPGNYLAGATAFAVVIGEQSQGFASFRIEGE